MLSNPRVEAWVSWICSKTARLYVPCQGQHSFIFTQPFTCWGVEETRNILSIIVPENRPKPKQRKVVSQPVIPDITILLHSPKTLGIYRSLGRVRSWKSVTAPDHRLEQLLLKIKDPKLQLIKRRFGADFQWFSPENMYTPENQHVPEKGAISIGNTSSNLWFSGDMLVFRGVYISLLKNAKNTLALTGKHIANSVMNPNMDVSKMVVPPNHPF